MNSGSGRLDCTAPALKVRNSRASTSSFSSWPATLSTNPPNRRARAVFWQTASWSSSAWPQECAAPATRRPDFL